MTEGRLTLRDGHWIIAPGRQHLALRLKRLFGDPVDGCFVLPDSPPARTDLAWLLRRHKLAMSAADRQTLHAHPLYPPRRIVRREQVAHAGLAFQVTHEVAA